MTMPAVAWVEPTATALRAVELAGELAGRTVLVTGGGPIGQLACRLAHLKSPAQILLMEPAAQRAQFATASHAVAIAADDARGPVVDVVLECSGSAVATSSALKLLAPGGILVVVGAGPEPALDSATILLKEITVRGSYIYNDEFDRAIELLATQQITVADLTTVISPLPDALAAFRRAARRRNHESPHRAGRLGSRGLLTVVVIGNTAVPVFVCVGTSTPTRAGAKIHT
jgi:threonine dehydrogenase-like Zn-dependent dehydrogenase